MIVRFEISDLRMYTVFMVISYLGGQSFKLQFGDIVIAYNPISKNSKLKSTSYGSDIALVSLNHPDMNGLENASRGDKLPFAIHGPGEYEINGVFIHAFPSKSKYGGKDRINTIYNVSLENMNLCFLGALSTTELSKEVLEEIEEIDILFVPIDGEDVLSAAEAYKLAISLEPKLIVPMYTTTDGKSKALETFLKEAGEGSPEKHDKLTIKKKDLEGKQANLVVFNPLV